jgi:dTDP-4-dehydrorhamnose 3,5-epimerase-like enzyme
MRKAYRISDVSIVDFPFFKESNGSLLIMESGGVVPFEIARVFFVKADAGAVRGNHAHYKCFQLLQCINGSISITCNDGNESVDYILDVSNQGLLIPPGIWASQTYTDNNSSLLVLCDQPFSEADYIRNYDEYLQYREDIN